MEGTIESGGNDFWWWAGPANDGAREGYCVHVRNATYGVTKYIASEPQEDEAKQIAESLIPMLGNLR